MARLACIVAGAVLAYLLLGCTDPVDPNIHPAPLVVYDSVAVEAP
jgi:hypothetical protein